MEEMGKLQNRPTPQNSKTINKQPIKGRKKPMKVTYISSPMMVRACNPSEFRALVQELTGKDSYICCQEEIGATTTTAEEGKDFDCFDVSKYAEAESVGACEEFLNVLPTLDVSNNGGSFWIDNSEFSLPGFQSPPCVFV
ncbi:VQ protein [Dillenia turbinata]|uniref:VQ protein n=1 Tax=Dillenia turbinata TaxID=194707 RepID=A0AAN8URJ5_9MAGN